MHSTSIMSLPAITGGVNAWDDIPTCPGLLNRTVRRIGFCWRAEEANAPLKLRSLPVDVAGWIGLYLSDYEVLSLSPTQSELYSKDEFLQPSTVLCEPDRMTDWAATRDYILSMDFVVTVDTAVAHLTGLLGVPALVLLPIGACWRWGMPGITAVSPNHLLVRASAQSLPPEAAAGLGRRGDCGGGEVTHRRGRHAQQH